MAAPLVAGVAALIFSQYPNLSAAQVKQILITSGVAINKKVSLEILSPLQKLDTTS